MTVCDYCELPKNVSGNCSEELYTEGSGDDMKCYKMCPFSLKPGVLKDSQGNPLNETNCKVCGSQKMYITCPKDQEENATDDESDVPGNDPGVPGDFLNDPSRQQQGTSAMYQNSFIQHNNDMFFVTADGFKQTYEKVNSTDEHHPTCQNFIDNTHVITKQEEFDAIQPSLVKRIVGTPCGFEEKVVGVKNTDGSYDRLGFVNSDGILQVFVNSTLDTIPETCPKTEIIDIPDTLWGEFTKGDDIQKDGKCNVSSRSTLSPSLAPPPPPKVTEEHSTPSVEMNIKAEDMINNIQEMNKQMEEARDGMEKMNAIQEVMETFRNFFKWRYVFFFIGIVLLFAFVYSFFSSSKGKQPIIDPGKAQEMSQAMAASAMATASTAAALASENIYEEPQQTDTPGNEQEEEEEEENKLSSLPEELTRDD